MVFIKDNRFRALFTLIFLSILLTIVIINNFSSDDYLRPSKDFELKYFIRFFATIFFLCWFRRAYHNLFLLNKKLRHHELWAIWGWFVPIFNFIIPIEIMRSIWRETYKQAYNTSRPSKNDIIELWWSLTIILFIAVVIILLLIWTENLLIVLQTEWLLPTLKVLEVLIGALLILIVYQIHKLEKLVYTKMYNQIYLSSDPH